jgi:putative lipoprotein
MIPRTSRRTQAAFVTLSLLALAAWSETSLAQTRARIVGTATYRERIALTPEAVFDATLEEVSRADETARVVARVRDRRPGRVPIAFEISYDPRRLDPRGRYIVRATIRDRGRLRFTGTQVVPIRSRGRRYDVNVVMRSPRAEEPRPQPLDRLGDAHWVAVRIDGRLVDLPAGREHWLEFDSRDGRVTGNTACNRLSGAYESGDSMLRFGDLTTTRMACQGTMDVEADFLRALDETWRYRIVGRTLELRDDRGRTRVVLEQDVR